MQSKNNYMSIVKIKMKKEHLLFNVHEQYQTKRKRGYIKKSFCKCFLVLLI